MAYLYETHLHTSEASKCGKVSGADYISYLIDKGYSGMVVTDHFFNGNTCIPQDLSWKARVEQYMSGYEAASAAICGRDFDVLFGVEFNFDKDEYLLYGIDGKWLADNEEIMNMTRSELFAAVHKAGGIMVQAHPFRQRDYISRINLSPLTCDAVEVYNAANSDNMNALAYEYASGLKLPMTSGSDIHYFHDRDMGGMLFDKRIRSSREYADSFRSGVPVRLTPGGRIESVDSCRELTVSTALPDLEVFYPEGRKKNLANAK